MSWRALLFATVISVSLGVCAPVHAQTRARESIIVRSYDTFGVAAGALRAAEGDVMRTYGAAGIEVQWKACAMRRGASLPAACADTLAPREVVMRTRTVTELAEIGVERLHALFSGPLADDCPKLLFAIGQQLTKRLLHTARKASRLAFMDVTSRITNTLNDLCQEPDAMSHPKGTQIRVSRQELARIVGCSREMAGRVLKQLEENGALEAHGKTVVVYHARG